MGVVDLQKLKDPNTLAHRFCSVGKRPLFVVSLLHSEVAVNILDFYLDFLARDLISDHGCPVNGISSSSSH